jgi:hypothetical protein
MRSHTLQYTSLFQELFQEATGKHRAAVEILPIADGKNMFRNP